MGKFGFVNGKGNICELRGKFEISNSTQEFPAVSGYCILVLFSIVAVIQHVFVLYTVSSSPAQEGCNAFKTSLWRNIGTGGHFLYGKVYLGHTLRQCMIGSSIVLGIQ